MSLVGNFDVFALDGDNLFVAISPVTMQLLAYANGHLHSRLPVDVDIMIDNAAATFHTNLFDTFIYICSTAVLDLFADQFDMQNIEHDLFAQVRCIPVCVMRSLTIRP